MDPQASTTYQPGGVTTRTEGAPYSNTADIIRSLILMRAQQMDKERAAADVPAVPTVPGLGAIPVAAPTGPPVIYHAPDPRQAARPASAAPDHRPGFVANNHGMNQIGGYSEAPEGSGNFYGGDRVTAGNPGVSMGESSRANTQVADSAAGAAHPSAQWSPPANAPSTPDDLWNNIPSWRKDQILRARSASEAA